MKAMKEKWMVAAKRADFAGIAERFQIDQVTARLIRNRGIVGDEAIEEYLNGSLLNLHDPALLKDCVKAAEILEEKIAAGRLIRIIGDYDIDGVNSTYILYRTLRQLGANVDYEIPDRIKDGYGLNLSLIREAGEDGVDTILTCDNGIAAVEQIEEANRLGMTVIVTDHHEPQYENVDGEERIKLPRAAALVNPKQPLCPYPYKNLCGAAVAYKLMVCLYRVMGLPEEETEELIEFAAFATVGDVMDLTGENRILVREGLYRLNHTENIGMQALIQANGLEYGKISAYHIGFVLGPCINASGRLDTAKQALALLLCESGKEAAGLAAELKELNDERKSLTAKGVEQAVALIEGSEMKNDRVLVVYLPDCHESLAGIIAGRLRERYYRPVFVLTRGKDGAKGSGRSIETYSMFQEMSRCRELFVAYGGHPMAAGLSLREEDVDVFRRRINELCTLGEDELTPKVLIDVPMPVDYITEKLIDELELLEPMGKGNQKPLFAEKDLRLLSLSLIGKTRLIVKMIVANDTGKPIDAVYFGDAELFLEELTECCGKAEVDRAMQRKENGIRLSLAYYPTVNEYRDQRKLQIVVQHYRLST